MALVFQYGSNTTTARLNGPSRLNDRARDLGRAQTVRDFEIAFDVYSTTNGCAAADLRCIPGQPAWGVLYEIADADIRGPSPRDSRTLADIEGSRYEEKGIRVRDKDGVDRHAITFVVKDAERRTGLATNAAYVSLIVDGLRSHGVPEDYVQHVIDVAVATNADADDKPSRETSLIETLR